MTSPITTATTTEQLAELFAEIRRQADRAQVDWKTVVNKGAALYKGASSAPKSTETMYRVQTVVDGITIESEQAKPYAWAVLVKTPEGWSARSWTTTKVVAYSRASAARKAVPTPEAILIMPATVVETIAPEADEPDPDAYAAQLESAEAERLDQIEAEREAAEEPLPFEPEAEPAMNVKVIGGVAVHAPTADYEGAICGASKSKDFVQTEEPISCKNCLRLINQAA